jgi:hypothetical protein
MPEITNPQVVLFTNQRIRPISDKLTDAYYAAKQIVSDYNSGDIGSKIDAAGAGNLIADGSETDGRTRLVGGDIYNMITLLQQYILFVENGVVTQADRTTVISKPHVNSF